MTREPFAIRMLTEHDWWQVELSVTECHSLHNDQTVDEWLRLARQNASQKSVIVTLDSIDGWLLEPQSGNIVHSQGNFFAITGVHARHRHSREEIEWDQPIIDQPEIGILGIIARPINGILHFCLQAKEEPGNIGNIQISPTVQATYSNFTGVHGGSAPPFLDYFTGKEPAHIIYARLQSEDGGRFLFKANRNLLVMVDAPFPVELPENFIWLTLRQIRRLICQQNSVNACVRSILSPLFSSDSSGTADYSAERLKQTMLWLDERRACNHIHCKHIGLNQLVEWAIDDKGFFSHVQKRFFRVVGLNVTTNQREVKQWGQPIIENPAAGIIGLLVRQGENGLELLMQAKPEIGNRIPVQLGPTVQFTQTNYEGSQKLAKPFLYDAFLHPEQSSIIHESRQTEEGARFFREYHLHRVIQVKPGMYTELPPDYRWLTTKEVRFFLSIGEQVNSCARSILSCLI